MKKFRTRFHMSSLQEIKEFRVVRETANQIIFIGETGREIRENKNSEFQNWFDSAEDAREFLVHQCEREIETLTKDIARAEAFRKEALKVEVKHD